MALQNVGNQVLMVGTDLDLAHLDPNFAADLVRRCPYFDSSWYQSEYPEIEYHENGNPDPAYHYANYGYKEQRLPSILFDGNRYSRFHNLYDVNPLLHYLQHQCPGNYRVHERLQDVLLKRSLGVDLTLSEKIFLFERNYSDNNHKTLNLLAPNLATISEKLYFLRAFDRSNLDQKVQLKDYTTMSRYLRQCGLSAEQAPEPLQICDSVDSFNLESLPESFKIKCNGLSQRTVYIRHKSGIKIADLKAILQSLQDSARFSLTTNLMDTRIKPQLVCFAHEIEHQNSLDIMVYCFQGRACYLSVQGNNQESTFFDRDFNLVPHAAIAGNSYKRIEVNLQKPACLDLLLSKCEQVAQNFPFIGIACSINKAQDQDFTVDSISFMPDEGNLNFSSDFELQLGAKLDISKIPLI